MELTQVNYHLNKTGPLDFYTMGVSDPLPPRSSYFETSHGYRSTSNNLLERNYFSIKNRNYETQEFQKFKTYSTINQQNIKENDYMHPLNALDAQKKFDLPTNMTNKETYNITKNKIFTKDRVTLLKNGQNLSHNEYMDCKNQFNTDYAKDPNSISTKNLRTLGDNGLVFDKNNQQMIRTKGNWIPKLTYIFSLFYFL